MKLKIIAYAAAKEFYGCEFELETGNEFSVRDLKRELIKIKPAAAALINVSRFAVDEIFVNEEKKLDAGQFVHIIPPSSGG